MSAVKASMEHRWGTRIDLRAEAKLMTAEGLCNGVLCNASLSGAYVETPARPALLSRVSVRPATPGAQWLDGWVVRVEARGIAVEWLDPPLHSVAVLLALHSVTPAPGSPRSHAAEPVVPLRSRQPVRADPASPGG